MDGFEGIVQNEKNIKKLYAVWFHLSKIFEMATFRSGKHYWLSALGMLLGTGERKVCMNIKGKRTDSCGRSTQNCYHGRGGGCVQSYR